MALVQIEKKKHFPLNISDKPEIFPNYYNLSKGGLCSITRFLLVRRSTSQHVRPLGKALLLVFH